MAHPPSSPHEPTVRVIAYTLLGGWQVLVGRTDADNDDLSFRVARPHDWWFHVRGMPGSHVILQGPPGADPDRQTLTRAAAIAAYHSTARHAGIVAVSGTRVRDVSKPRGATAGTVQIRHERVFRVHPARGDLAGDPGNASAEHPVAGSASVGATPALVGSEPPVAGQGRPARRPGDRPSRALARAPGRA